MPVCSSEYICISSSSEDDIYIIVVVADWNSIVKSPLDTAAGTISLL